jgi:hypothetical protein
METRDGADRSADRSATLGKAGISANKNKMARD